MARSRDISKVLSSNSTLASTYQTKATTGLVLLNTQTFSAVGSVSFPTNTFSAAYNTYSFTFNCIGSTAIQLLARLRAAGVDNSAASYERGNWESVAAINTSRDTGQTSLLVGELYDSDMKRRPVSFVLCDPQVSGRYTTGITQVTVNNNSSIYPIQRFHTLTVTTSYDSITFLTSSGTMTGSISCYGYNQ
jgi:hypothetical protein